MYICTILQCITDCVEGEVRLVGGETDSEGTIEVCLNSVWGLITDAGWDQNDAHVVCRQLNLPIDGILCVCVSVCLSVYVCLCIMYVCIVRIQWYRTCYFIETV